MGLKVASSTVVTPDELIRTASVLVVEDDHDYADLVMQRLTMTRDLRCTGHHVGSIGEALDVLADTRFDIVVLDLGLPDVDGLDGINRIRASHDVPILVVTGSAEKTTAIQAIQSGAQDYLFKDAIDTDTLSRALRYSIERHELLGELERSRQRDAREAEMGRLEDLGEQGQRASVTAGVFGHGPLRKVRPDLFEAACDRYREILDDALYERAYKVDHSSSDRLRELATWLGRLRCGPRDVIDVHRRVVQGSANQASNADRAQAYLEEGRFRGLELMGYLAGFYRASSGGASGTNSSTAEGGRAAALALTDDATAISPPEARP